MPIDYSKGKIYKLTTIHNPDLVYYGSTVNPLYKRKGSHKSYFKCNRLDCTSFKLFELGIDDVEITLVENINCNSKEELHQRERFYIENNNCVNKFIPTRTIKEYRKQNYEQNKDKIKESSKKNYEQNKDKIKQYQQEYREQNKDKLIKQRKENYEENKDKIKEQRKEYRELNKDKIKEQKKEYREQNKDKIKESSKENYEQNKDKILNRQKEYREQNKDKIREQRKEYRKKKSLLDN
jgi:hypothetical protein